MSRFILEVKQGRLTAKTEQNRARLSEHLKENEGKKYRLQKIQEKRSLNQNSYYWLYLGVIEVETGNNATDLHEIFKRKFLPPRFVTYKGKEVKLPRSATDLSKLDMGEYLDKISAECDVPLPDREAAGFIIN